VLDAVGRLGDAVTAAGSSSAGACPLPAWPRRTGTRPPFRLHAAAG